MKNTKALGWLFVVILLAALTFVPAMAQAYKANLYITVVTDDGNPSVDATVILTGQAGARTVQTDSKGLARFSNIDPGTYSAEVTQKGYNIAVHQGLRLATGAKASIEIVLQRSELVEIITVTSITPLMDRRNSGTSTVISPEEINKIPTARDPWAVMATVPGIQTDRINVGGNQSGQQSNFTGKGDDGDNTTWVMDGVEFSDLAAEGGSSTYFDFNSFQEIGFSTAGGDIEQLSPGTRLTFVTKQGSNHHTGSIGLILGTNSFQSDPAAYINPNGDSVTGNEINEVFEKNFELGGPIVTDKAWYWIGFNQNDIDLLLPGPNETQVTDRSKLRNTTAKITGLIGGSSNYKAFYTRGDKIKIGRSSGPTRPQETSWNQSGPTPIWTGDFSHFFSPNFELSAQISNVGGGFGLVPQGAADQMYRDDARVWHNTYLTYITDRPTDQITLRANWFVDGDSVSNEFKFGFKYKEGEVQSLTTYGGQNVVADDWYGTAWLIRPGTAKESIEYTSLWAQDTILWGNWTFNLGALMMDQSGKQLASTSIANVLCPTCLPDLVFGGSDPGFEWSDVVPRIGVTYSIDTNRKQLIKFNYGQYVDELHVSEVAFNHVMNPAEIDYLWDDLNSDTIATPDEIDFTAIDWFGNVDPNNPASLVPVSRIDPNLSAPTVDEFIIGYEIEIAKDFTLGLNYTIRERDNTTWSPLVDVDNNILDTSFYELWDINAGVIDCYDDEGPCLLPGAGGTYEVTSYVLNAAGAALALDNNYGSYLTNRPDYTEDFESWEFVATKRLSNKWMLRGYLSLQDWTKTIGVNGITDPTNLVGDSAIIGTSPKVVSGGSASGLFGDVFLGTSSWTYNVNGLYQLPHNFTISGNLNGREGYTHPLFFQDFLSDGNISTFPSVQMNSVDSYRMDDLHILDLKLGYLMKMSGDTTIDFGFEIFNITDDDTILQMDRRVLTAWGASSAGRIDEVLSPRIFRLGAKITF